ncbi:MAG: heme ABC exporter ATP-binding protein CcmA [Rhodospirillaceae bacterium]
MGFTDFMTDQFSGTGLACFRGGRMVFAGLSFRLSSGGAILLKGPNGSGKSSLLRVMAGLLQPATGMLSWHDGDVTEEPETHFSRLHYVGHHDAVKPVLTVAENVRFWARLRGGGEGVEAALEGLAIRHLADVPGRFLSAGQKRRVNLARVLAHPATLWLLDEPTTALDTDTIKSFEQACAAHRARGGMVVASTHAELALDGAEVLNLADFQTEEAYNDGLP